LTIRGVPTAQGTLHRCWQDRVFIRQQEDKPGYVGRLGKRGPKL
jgi:hypothetical protein